MYSAPLLEFLLGKAPPQWDALRIHGQNVIASEIIQFVCTIPVNEKLKITQETGPFPIWVDLGPDRILTVTAMWYTELGMQLFPKTLKDVNVRRAKDRDAICNHTFAKHLEKETIDLKTTWSTLSPTPTASLPQLQFFRDLVFSTMFRVHVENTEMAIWLGHANNVMRRMNN